MCPEDFEKSLPKEVSTCRSRGSQGEWIERICDYVILESRPHKCNGLRVKSCNRSWNEEEREDVLCRAKALQKVPELVVLERMSQGEEAKGIEEKKKVKGWSTDEMKNKARDDREDDTEGNDGVEIHESGRDGSMLGRRLRKR